MTTATAHPPAKRRMGWKTILSIFLLTISLGALIAYLLFISEPAHWKEHQALLRTTTPEQRQADAINLEHRFLNALSYSQPVGIATGNRQSDPGLSSKKESFANPADHADTVPTVLTDGLGQRHIRATAQEINAWLEIRLPQVLANQNIQLPPEIQQPMIVLRDRQLILSFRFAAGKSTTVVSLHFEPQMVQKDTTAPKLRMQLAGVQGGRLPLPASGLTSSLRKQAEEKRNQLIQQVAASLEGQAFDPVFASPDGQRLIRLTGFSLTDQNADLQLNIEPKAQR